MEPPCAGWQPIMRMDGVGSEHEQELCHDVPETGGMRDRGGVSRWYGLRVGVNFCDKLVDASSGPARVINVPMVENRPRGRGRTWH